MKVVIDDTKCAGSGECVQLCPRNALSLADGKAKLDPEKCDGDGICVPACPNYAIRLVD